ncbi:MAG: YcxB family protein [Anaerolineae bacterium]|nr:YcxB family protein [Anaerolineae bacterium]
MHEIEFTNTPDDLVALTQHHDQHNISNSWKNYSLVILLLLFMLTVIISLIQSPFVNYDGPDTNWIIYLPPFVVVFLIYWYFRSLGNPKSLRTNVAMTYKDWDDIYFNCPNHLQIMTGQLVNTKPGSQFSASWDTLRKAAYTPDYAFLYTGPTTAIIIPKERVSRGDFDAFVAELQQHIQPTLD